MMEVLRVQDLYGCTRKYMQPQGWASQTDCREEAQVPTTWPMTKHSGVLLGEGAPLKVGLWLMHPYGFLTLPSPARCPGHNPQALSPPSLSLELCSSHMLSLRPPPLHFLSADSCDKEKRRKRRHINHHYWEGKKDHKDASGTRRIIFWALEANKFDNLCKMDNPQGRPTSPNLDTTKIENLNNFLSTKVIKFLTENHPTKKTPGPDGFTGEFRIIKKEMPLPIVHTHSWEPLATGYIRPDSKTRQKHLMAREICTNSPHDCICKIL